MGDVDEATKSNADDQVFKEKWMNQCYKNLSYPNPACVQVLDKVNRALVSRVTQPQNTNLKQQALFSLLGREFVEQHFPLQKYAVSILEPPRTSPKNKEKYMNEMREFLLNALNQAMADCDYPDDVSSYKEEDELGHFLHEVRTSFREGLRKHTAIVMFEEETERERQKEEKRKRNVNDGDGFDTDDGNDTDDELELARRKAQKMNTGTKPSDIAGRALVAFIAHDESLKWKYMERIRERHLGLPRELRRFFWWEFLKGKEAAKLKPKPEDDMKELVRRNFDKTLAKEMKSQKVNRATRSNNWKAIDNAVIENYDNTACLATLDTDEHMIETTRTLNILDVHSKQFCTAQIYWLIPLQLVFDAEGGEGDEEHMMTLASYLELVTRHCMLSNKDVFDIAEKVIKMVNKEDPDYYAHITKCLSEQVSRVNLKDFPPEILVKDTKVSVKLHAELVKRDSKELKPKYQKIFTDPAIFVRKWLVQGYMGALSIASGLWVWDELFLSQWQSSVFERVGVAVISLIKPWMLRAKMYSGARKVFLDEPGKIYLSDLRKAVAHLDKGAPYAEIPSNKNFVEKKADQKNQAQVERREPQRRRDSKGDQKDKNEAKETEKEEQDSQRRSPPPARSRAAVAVLPFAADRLFHVDINLDFDDDDGDPLPIPEPPPDSESEPEPTPTPTPPRSPTPPPPTPPPPPRTPTPPPPPEHWAWLPYEKAKVEPLLPAPTRVTEPCDFYIDAVRFLPDNISHCKVTGRFINMYLSKDEKVPDILAYPLLDSSTRSPSFRYKVQLNKDRVFLNPEMVIILRVYGYENHTKKVVVVGSCLVGVFNAKQNTPTLSVGGVQRRIRHGLPNPLGGLQALVMTDMDDNDPIPGVSICVRLLPSSSDYVAAPPYEDGYYRSADCRPTEAERNLFRHYVYQKDYGKSLVGDHLRSMQASEGKLEDENGPRLQRYMEDTLDQKAQQARTKEQVPNVDYVHYVHYDIKMGFKACVLGVFGLPMYMENRYCHVYCQVLPGEEVKDLPSTPEGYGHDQRFITKKVDFLSAQRSPQWLDEPVTLHPHYDKRSVLLVQLFGFTPSYRPGDGTKPGKLTDSKGNSVQLHYDRPMAWGVMQLFEKNSLISGVHWLTMFKGSPHPDVLKKLYRTAPAHKVLLDALRDEQLKLHDGMSMEVKIWDGHMGATDLRDGRNEIQISTLGNKEKYTKVHQQAHHRSIDEFVLQNMDTSLKQNGPIGERFEKERTYFEKEANYAFFKAMDEALKEAGQKHLP
ncbi:uncharacterized protein LOC122258822 [Penaeus japonicus]|uniref:uncharacterized protein LOC122258822 n=1 Tax=Penaeus japonicus TaxID=27405 RepID=UPI001C70BE93|nr:uncharacterized protein LOC122258822 [Penaeus japonicus]